jgi:hypothetical protein
VRIGYCRILVGRPEGKNAKTYLTEIEWDGMDWIYPAQDGNR